MPGILLKNILSGTERKDILILGGRIGKTVPAGSEDIVSQHADIDVMDCTGKVAVPGFVNAHTHAAMTLMRGLGEDVCFADWIEKIWDVEKNIDEDYVYWATRVACIEMVKTGTTSFLDQYWHTEAAARAVSDSGLRAVLSYVHLDRFDPHLAARQREECRRIADIASEWPDTLSFSVAVHSVYSVSVDQILWAADFARSRGFGINVHLCETEKEVADCRKKHGVSPVRFLADLGVLGPDVIAAHTLWVDEEDIEILAEHNVSCVHNINSNLKLSSGYRFPYVEMKNAGINVCLGTDGCASSNNLDLLEAMKTSAIVQKAWRKDPSAMPLGELFAMGTVNGAKALGLDCGVLAEGALADILIVDTDSTFFLSKAPFLADFIYSAHSDCIDSAICNGRFVMKNRRIEGEREVLEEARKVLMKL